MTDFSGCFFAAFTMKKAWGTNLGCIFYLETNKSYAESLEKTKKECTNMHVYRWQRKIQWACWKFTTKKLLILISKAASSCFFIVHGSHFYARALLSYYVNGGGGSFFVIAVPVDQICYKGKELWGCYELCSMLFKVMWFLCINCVMKLYGNMPTIS